MDVDVMIGKWNAFMVAVARRIVKGRREYGDASFERSPSALIGEIRQEVADIVGWAFVLDTRLERLLEQGARLGKPRAPGPKRSRQRGRR